MKRRSFLKNSAALGIGSYLSSGILGSLIPSTSFAQTLNGRFLVVLRLSGGWDVTLGPDAWVMPEGADEKDLFIEYRADQILRSQQLMMGPAMAPLLPWTHRMSIINGILMSHSNQDHVANLNYAVSGDASLKNADFSVELASHDPALLGILSGFGLRTLDRKVPVTRVGNLSALGSSVIDEDMLSDEGRVGSPIDSGLREVRENSPRILDLVKKITAIPSDVDSDTKEAMQVAMAFESGLSSILDMSVFGGGNLPDLDTHQNHVATHLRGLTGRFDKIAKYLKVFESRPYGTSGESLLDRTVFYIASEFARTPALSSSAGKDHNPLTNSAILIGHGIQGGRVWGQSRLLTRKTSGRGSPQHVASLVNKTGQVALTKEEALSGDFEFVRPANVLNTIVSALDLSPGLVPALADGKHPAISALLRRG